MRMPQHRKLAPIRVMQVVYGTTWCLAPDSTLCRGAGSRNADVRSMHASVRVLLRTRLSGCADLPTMGSHWVLQQYMELLLALLEVAIALLSHVYDFQEVASFGTLAMRVRCHLFSCLRCPAVLAAQAPAQFLLSWSKADEQQLTMLHCVLLSSLLLSWCSHAAVAKDQ